MKRISAIEFLNYKAFYGTGDNNKLKIPKGNNVLIYGENGSGKSSIYEGVKQFLESSVNTQDITPARNLRVKEFEEVNRENENGIPVRERIQNEIGVKITFDSFNSQNEVISTDEIVFTNKENTTIDHIFLRQALSLNSFLSYRELLKTYLVDNPKNRENFQVQLGKLLIETLLAERINSVTQTKNIDEWKRLFTPRIRYKEHFAKQLELGILKDIENINLYLSELVHYFDKSLNVKLILKHLYVDYLANETNNRIGLYPYVSADLDIEIQELKIEDSAEIENHLTVLNEARLSSLAISIYLASILSTPQENFDFKILFLDDIFIGLDMSNRLPLLEIITKYNKPKLIQEVNNDGEIVTIIEKANDIIIREEKSFFSDYQIFITTYDRNWYEVAKDFLENTDSKKWSKYEVYKDNSIHDFDVPAIYAHKTNLTKAEDYIIQHDYRAAAIYLRSEIEKKLEKILPQSSTKKIKNEDGTTNQRTENKNLNDLLIAFENILEQNSIPNNEFQNLKLYKSHILNALSHNDSTSKIYKRELQLVVESVKKLENIVLKKANPSVQDFEIRLEDVNDLPVIISFRKRDVILFYEFNGNTYLLDSCTFQYEGKNYNNQGFQPDRKDLATFSSLLEDISKEYHLKNYDLKHVIYSREKTNKPSISLLDLIMVNI
ncbi:hypothetical protein [Elizabethkingia anophelis]|uniref:hypothetical protein n=1 Tax=Elizabethkingia anophelis TaxID=1117645 RepID=UPI0012B3ACD9|nr:hypothetical protein [Elizabethkingia anophelis]QGN23683.1 hypothetical protein GJV56_13855 [Elizabethkingia anophelis]QNV10326.1 hypothetical protein EIY88_13805 [Elizabethkingia anophelis]UTF88473.1 hypothetical protein J2N93_13915 [Elizabethkingia anophelis]UTF99375.1 hypothetical protein J2O04_14030 [Elizabethkingia anophelis]UTG03109.1 hypothetical protein J2O03_13910 [Elizabethkingia anophelis]